MDSISTDEESNVDVITSIESFEFGDFHENLSDISEEICQDFWKPNIDYDDWSCILSKVPEIVDAIFGPDLSPTDLSSEEDLPSKENESTIDQDPIHCSESGSILWKKYSECQDSDPLSWKTSSIRQMLFTSLEIPINLDKMTNSHKKLENKYLSSINTSSHPPFGQTFNNESTTHDDSTLPDLNTQMTRILYLKSDEDLSNLSLISLKSHLLELEIIQEKSKQYLEYWTKRIKVDFSQSVSKLSDLWRKETNQKRKKVAQKSFAGFTSLEKGKAYKEYTNDNYHMVFDHRDLKKKALSNYIKDDNYEKRDKRGRSSYNDFNKRTSDKNRSHYYHSRRSRSPQRHHH
ncbi:hypothetical protein PCK1_002233 [Pneumocystis canis]|nr:hypothetical protein PCK1_002233 [Pneumocystis canis]